MHVGVKAVHTDRGEESNNELAVSLQHDISSPQPAHSFWMFLQTHLSRIPPVCSQLGLCRTEALSPSPSR